jgi:hypothetical protein
VAHSVREGNQPDDSGVLSHRSSWRTKSDAFDSTFSG